MKAFSRYRRLKYFVFHVLFLRELLEDVLHQNKGVNQNEIMGSGQQEIQHVREVKRNQGDYKITLIHHG